MHIEIYNIFKIDNLIPDTISGGGGIVTAVRHFFVNTGRSGGVTTLIIPLPSIRVCSLLLYTTE